MLNDINEYQGYSKDISKNVNYGLVTYTTRLVDLTMDETGDQTKSWNTSAIIFKTKRMISPNPTFVVFLCDDG